MRLTPFVCYVFCFVTLATAGKPWKKMQSKLKRILKSSTDFVHVVSGHKGVTNDGFELTKKAAVVSLRNRHEFGGILSEEMNFSIREVHQPKDSDFIDIVNAFVVPRVHVKMTTIKAWMSSKFDIIPPLSTELVVIERLDVENNVLLTLAVDRRAPIGYSRGQFNFLSTISFVQFSDPSRTVTEFYPRRYNLPERITEEIKKLAFQKGNTAAVGNGLRNAQIILDGYSWNERPRIAWLVTNRFAEVGLNAEHVATQMKEAGIKLFVVGIGHINRWEELRKLATSKKFYFGFDTYNEYFDTVKKAVGGIKRRNRKG